MPKFAQSLLSKKTKIKPLLLDQSFIAGIGNIYAAEILFLSGIHPAKQACKISSQQLDLLFRNIKKVLISAIKHRGSSVDLYYDAYGHKGNFEAHLLVYNRQGQLCLRCKHKIQRIVLSGRGTYFCPNCQK